jgi:DNA-binding transcriptional regulator GbsR (MarR family)
VTGESVSAAVAAELAAEGFPRLPAQVLMALMVSPTGTMTAAELSGGLGVSPAAVSGAIRYLGVLGFVRVAVVPGTRRHVYSLPAVPWYASTLVQDRYSSLLALLDDGLRDLEPGAVRDRLAEMADFFRFLRAEMPRLWERWRAAREAED